MRFSRVNGFRAVFKASSGDFDMFFMVFTEVKAKVIQVLKGSVVVRTCEAAEDYGEEEEMNEEDWDEAHAEGRKPLKPLKTLEKAWYKVAMIVGNEPYLPYIYNIYIYVY